MTTFTHTSGSTLLVEGAEIYFETAGDPQGPVILCLHGGFGSMADFNPVLEGLHNFRVLAMDSRGHGRSTMGSAGLTYERLEKDVSTLLAHLRIHELSIIGFSDGGTVGCRLAVLPSLKVQRLVTIGATWHNDQSTVLEPVFSTIDSASWRANFPETVETYERCNPVPNFELFTEAVLTMWRDQTPAGHPNERVRHVECPTLVVRGDHDSLVSLQWCVELMELIEDSHLLNIPFAGHAAFSDQPEVFLAAAKPFLSSAPL